MFASPARTEVINDRSQIGELAGGIGPDTSAMSFLRARCQHLYRGLVWGVMFLGERLSAAHLYGGGLICLAVWFVLGKTKPKQEPSPASS